MRISSVPFQSPGDVSTRQEEMLRMILASCEESPVYRDLVPSRPAFTGYSDILSAYELLGEEACMLSEHDFILSSSGSTGKPKRLPYTWEELRAAAAVYHPILVHLGMEESMRLWEMSATIPFMSGPLSKCVVDTFEAENEIVFSPISDPSDVFDALRKVSRGGHRFDVVSMQVLFFYILHQALYDPGFLDTIVGNMLGRWLRPLTPLVSAWLGRGIDKDELRAAISSVRYVFCSAAPVAPYGKILAELFPQAEIVDIWASTENALMGIRPPGRAGHYLLIHGFVPELLPTEELLRMENEDGYRPVTIPLEDWRPGQKGELLVSRPGKCLPLLRYRTGDHIEVLDPCEMDEGAGPFRFLPMVCIKGRTTERLDFFDPEQWGAYHSDEVHFSDVDDVLRDIDGLAWWELYVTRGLPRRIVVLTIADEGRSLSADHVRSRLVSGFKGVSKVFEISNMFGDLDVVVLPHSAFRAIQAEKDRLSRERGPGRVKPRRLFTLDDEESIHRHLRSKYGEHPSFGRR